MNIKEKWVSWEEFNLLFPGISPTSSIDYSRIGGLIPGSIPFADATGMLTEDNANFFWDEANIRLGIGTATPGCTVDIEFPAVVSVVSRVSAKTRPWRHWECIDGNWGLAIGIDADDGIIHFNYDTPIGTVDTSMMVFDGPNGRIGILDATPAYPLDVGGNTRIQGTFRTTGAVVLESALGVTGTATFNGLLTNTAGAKIEIQGGVDGGSTRGIFLWDTTSTNWGIYLSESGAGKSLSDGIACTNFAGDTGHHIRFRISDTAARAFIWENSSETCLMDLEADTGNLTILGNFAVRSSAEIRFYDNGNYVGFEAPALGADQIWVLPNADGGAGTAIITDNAGNLSFTGSPVLLDSDFGSAGFMHTDGAGTYSIVPGGEDIVRHNIYLGTGAGISLVAGSLGNVMFGEGAGNAMSTGDYGVFIGYQAGLVCTASNNLIIGYQAGLDVNTGTNNVLMGDQAGFNQTTPIGNVAIGAQALVTNIVGFANTALGMSAGYWNTASYNVFLGKESGANNRAGNQNTYLGYRAGYLNRTGSSNLFLGASAGASCGTAPANIVAIGNSAGNNVEGGYNVFIGTSAGSVGTSVWYSVIIGTSACVNNVTGDRNTIIGYQAGYGVATNSHQNNVMVGVQCAVLITVGNNNTLIGTYAGNNLTSGSGNVCLGYAAGDGQLTTDSNELWIANSGTATPLIYGEFPNALLKIQATNFNVIGTTNLGDGGVTNYAEIKTDGEINLHGTARVVNGQWIDAQGIKAPQTNPAELISFGLLETPAFQFADAIEANQENVTFNMRLPYRMDKGVAPFLAVGWSAVGISPGDCRWQLEYLYTKLNDNTALGAQDTVLVTSTASATTNGMVMAIFPAMELPEATDICVHCRVTRLSADGADTIADTVELHGLCLSFTVDRLGLAT